MSSSETKGTLVVGLSHPQPTPDAARLLELAREDHYDYVTTVLPHSLNTPRTDVTALESRWWRTSVVGVVEDPGPNDDSRLLSSRLAGQMEWAAHMGIPAVLLPMIKNDDDYARAVSSAALKASATNGQVWIRTQFDQNSLNAFNLLHRQCDGASNVGMMLVLDEDTALPTSQAPGALTAMVGTLTTLVHKAIGSQLKAVCFPCSAFLTNKKGFPTLASKTHQVIFAEILRRIGRTVRVLIEGPSRHERVANDNGGDSGNQGGATGYKPYLQYIRHMRGKKEVSNILDTEEATMEEPYLDHLQRPLQPLSDHLEFQTYETFEKDPIKYTQYQRAIALALRDGWSTVTNVGKPTRVTILIVGAGRGPLVTAALDAIRDVRRLREFEGQPPLQAQVWAVEKNPSAVLYLESMARHESTWKEARVRVLHMDMRQLSQASLEQQSNGGVVDIVVSELLGSFGDNELSPECIDGVYATGLLKSTTVCIPQNYTSYLAPVSSMRMHSEARAQAYFPTSASDGLDSAPMGPLRAMETPYVVRSHAACQTNVEQKCWDYCHPRTAPGVLRDNERLVHLSYEPDPTCGAGCGCGYGPYDSDIATLAQLSGATTSGPATIHGFLGTFSATLYQSPRPNEAPVVISTKPSTFSVGMFSWFPLYFPLKEPLVVPSGATLMASVWRKMETNDSETSGRVWYEWCAKSVKKGEVLGMTPIHNPNGRSYHVDL